MHRQQVVRAYDRNGNIADGILAGDGDQALAVIREMLARPEVTLVHLRNVGWGCYNFAVRAVTRSGLQRYFLPPALNPRPAIAGCPVRFR